MWIASNFWLDEVWLDQKGRWNMDHIFASCTLIVKISSNIVTQSFVNVSDFKGGGQGWGFNL